MAASDLHLSASALQTREGIAADALRRAILRGTFKPGDKLDQQELADQLGISRSPVREALRTLAAEELVTLIPHRGAIVTERSLDELRELLFIRSLLEGAAARRAATAMDASRLTTLRGLIESAATTDAPEELLELNNEFHATVYSAFAQPHLMALIQQLRNKVAPYNRLYLDAPGHKQEAWADHTRIYEACQQQDPDAAEAATRQHLERVFNALAEERT